LRVDLVVSILLGCGFAQQPTQPQTTVASQQILSDENSVAYARRRVLGAPERSVCSARDAKNVVPMEGTRLLPLVAVKINGKGPYRLLFDTGANVTVLQRRVADELKLPVLRDGQESKLVAVDRMEIGSTSFEGLVAGARSWDEQIDGVLGFNIAAACLVTLDYPTQHFEFTNGSLSLDRRQNILPYEATNGSPFVTASVGASEIRVLIDSGAADAFLFANDYRTKLAFKGALQRGKTLHSMNVQGGTLIGRLRWPITIGRLLQIESPLVQIDAGDTVDPGYAHIGSRVWQFFRLTFDQQHRLVEIVGERTRINPRDLEHER
jgi:hypothetical protein